jgi:hypothetical protein
MELLQYIKLNWNSSRNEVENTEWPKSQLIENILSYYRKFSDLNLPVNL